MIHIFAVHRDILIYESNRVAINEIDSAKHPTSIMVRVWIANRMESKRFRILFTSMFLELIFPRVEGEEVTHTFYLIVFWQGEVDYQNNSSYIFKKERKHSLGATDLSAVYTRWLCFNGSPYLGNENEISSRSHFPIDKMMSLTWSKWTYRHSVSSSA